MPEEGIGLADLIVAVSDDIRAAKSRNKGKDAVLQLADCELELAVNVSVEGKAGLKFWVVDIGGGGSVERAHRIKLSFKSHGETNLFSHQEDDPGEIPEQQKRRGKKK